MPNSAALTKTAPPPGPRFTDQSQAMAVQLALTGAINGTDQLITALRGLEVPDHCEHGHAETLNVLAAHLQDLRNLQTVVTDLIRRQTAEGWV